MSIIDELKGDETLDTSMTFKINADVKKELIATCEKYGVSVGKFIRMAIERLEQDIKNGK